MADIINLNQARKARAKAARAALAAQNRLFFGRPKGTKALAEKKNVFEASRLDGHKLEDMEKS